MKSNIIRAFTGLMLSVSPFSLVRAQTAYPDVSMKIDLVAWGDGISGLSLHSGAGNKTSAVSAFPFSYSKAVPYSGPSLMEIYQTAAVEAPVSRGPLPEDASIPILPDENADKAEKMAVPPLLRELRKKKPNLVALATLPVGSRRATVLLAPGPDHTFQTFTIDDDPNQLPFGRVRIHNLTPFPIVVRCKGGKALQLKPKETVVAIPENHYIFYELGYQDGEEWKILKNDMLRVADDEQAHMVVLKSDNQFFRSSDGSMGGAFQVVVLRRTKEAETAPVR